MVSAQTESQPEPVPSAPPAGEPSVQPDSAALIIKFFEKLDGAIRNKVLSPETFAIGVIDEIGPEQTAMLLQKFSPSEIVDTAQQLSGDSVIPTRDGQKFVVELWRAATAKVQERGVALG